MAKFDIHHEYFRKVDFYGRLDAGSPLSINIDTSVIGQAENMYEVILAISLLPENGKSDIFRLAVEYCAVVTLNLPGDTEKEEIRRVLMVDVPHILFPVARDLIKHISFSSLFTPILLPYFDFEKNYQARCGAPAAPATEAPCATPQSAKELSYCSIVARFGDSEEGSGFLTTCAREGIDTELDFEESPMYKYLMRFISVPLFRRPTFEGVDVDDSLFDAIYRMMMMNDKAACRFVAGDTPELYVTHGLFNDRALSSMSMDEIECLATSLIVDSWVYYNMPLSKMFVDEDAQSEADEYLEDLNVWDLISLSEYLNLFTRYASPLYLDLETVRAWHRRLSDIDVDSIPYRF